MRVEFDFEIFDFHMHPFVDAQYRCNAYQIPKDHVELMDLLSGCGVSGCAGSVVRPVNGEDFRDVIAMNDEAMAFQKLYRNVFYPGIHVHPDFPRESCAELQRRQAEGCRLIGELVPYMTGYEKYDTPAMAPVWDLAQQLGMLLSIHPTSLDDMEGLLQKFPKLNVVIAHPGERADYLARLELLKRHDNAYMDICGTGLFRFGMLKYGVDLVGSEKFLFGTDFPVCSIGMQIGGVLAERITDPQRRNIFALNARRLLGI